MREDRPSRTAHFVALGRAMADAGLSHVPGFADPTARVFLTDKGQRNLAKVQLAAKQGKRGVSMAFARTGADMMALRTSAIDAAVRGAVASGAKQLVILGAGYDGRAWRMRELSGVKVFEVDHPATQGDKRNRAASLSPAIGAVSFVPINFETESLSAVLDRAGHDDRLPTCWIWEGVVMYLTHDAVHATLRDVASRSASGSALIVNYHTEHRRWIARLLFRLIGEPQISAWTPQEMAATLGDAGFSVREDTGMLDWNARFANSAGRVERGSYMRIAVAQR